MAVGRKTNAKGRSTGKHPFVMMGHFAFDCSAYRSLKLGPRALLWEFVRKHNGANNGFIAFSQRDMSSAIGVADRETIAAMSERLKSAGSSSPADAGPSRSRSLHEERASGR